MPLPPEHLPEGMTAEEYAHLARLYTVMGNQDKAFEASKRATALAHAPDGGSQPTTEGLSGQTDYDRGEKLGQALGNCLMNAFQKLAKVGNADFEPNSILREFIDEAKRLGAKPEEMDAVTEIVRQALASLDEKVQTPPREVPTSGLSAQEYFDLGLRYKECGWTEQARDALKYSMERDPEGDVGKRALGYLRSKIPRHPVPLLAEQSNIEGFNQMVSGDTAGAKKTFCELIRTHPDFEWPYGNLGSLYVREGNLELAEETLVKAVEINPYYVNAWLHLSRANMLSSKFDQARYCLKRVHDIDPNESSLTAFEQILNDLERWDQEHKDSSCP